MGALKNLAMLLAALALAAPLAASVEPAVQPGGDIPRDLRPPPPQAQRPYERIVLPPSAYQYSRREAMIPMRDGARLYTVLIFPKGIAKAPILLDRTPYSARKATERAAGPLPENILAPMYAELIRAGYILAVQDVRGKYDSEGEYVLNRPLRGPLNDTAVDHSTDAFDTIDWLVKHLAESNGRVGTIGTSYNGFTALMSLVDPHPALKASVPINPMVDVWKGDDWFHNGAFRQQMASFVYGQTAAKHSDENWFPSGRDDYNAFLRHGSAGAYGRSMGMDRLPFWRRLLQHPDYDDYWQAQALDKVLARRPLTVPTLLVGSLWDQEDIYGAPAVFAAVKASPNAHLVLGPWYHGQMNYPALSLGPLDFRTDTARWFRTQVMLPFLDKHLKGGAGANIGRVMVFDTGPNAWRSLSDWPLACMRACPANLTPLHLAPGRRLTWQPTGASGFDSYVSDPTRPVTYRAHANLSPWAQGSTWRTWLVDDQRFAAARPDVLTFASEPLPQPLKLAGTPLVHLVASTSGTDSDWVVKLIDVYPEGHRLAGYQLPLAMEVMRGRYRGDPARPAAVPADQPMTYEFALPQVSYTIAPGHRLMVQVQSSWFPLYDRNPQTFVPSIFFARPNDYRAATQRVFHSSWIGLPIVR